MTVSNVQVWILTGVLTFSVGVLSFFSAKMYGTFEELQKSVRLIATDIEIIKHTQTYYATATAKIEEQLQVHSIEIQNIDRRVSRIEDKSK